MKNLIKSIVIASAVALTLSGFAGCSKKTGTANNNAVVGITQEPGIFDPHTVVAAGDEEIIFNVSLGRLCSGGGCRSSFSCRILISGLFGSCRGSLPGSTLPAPADHDRAPYTYDQNGSYDVIHFGSPYSRDRHCNEIITYSYSNLKTE